MVKLQQLYMHAVPVCYVYLLQAYMMVFRLVNTTWNH